METIKWKPNKVPSSICSKCGYKMDMATGENKPYPGALSICIACANLAKYDDNLLIVELTESERKEIETSKEWPNIRKIIDAVRQQIVSRRKNGQFLYGEKQ